MVNIPEKFYVALQQRGEDEILAYMVVADKEHTKAFQNTKAKADAWAVPSRWDADRRGHKVLEPIYVDNKPRTGFRMVTNVSRYSTSNVVWRIKHPEGFEFEITSDNLCDLMETNTISEGMFMDELFFTEGRKLVNSKTKLYADMIQKEENKKEHKAKSNVLEVGSTIQCVIPDRYQPENRDKDCEYQFVYCGKYHTCNPNKNRPMVVTAKSSQRPVLLDLSTGEYRTFSDLPDFTVLGNELVSIDRTVIINTLNEKIRSNNNKIPKYYEDGYIPNEMMPIFFSEKSYNYSDLKIVYQTVNSTEVSEIDNNKIYRTYNGYRIFGFYFLSGRHTYEAEYRGAYERPDTDLTVNGLLGEQIISEKDNGFPEISTDIFSHKEVIGFYGPFKANKLSKIPMPETIDVGYYTLGE